MPNGNVFHLANHLSANRLVFVTSPRALGQMGWAEADLAGALAGQTLVVLTDTVGDVVDRANAAATEFAELRPSADEIDGVVIIGGYDSVPPQRVDPLPSALRTQVENLSVYDDGQTDSDNYYVWNDDHYVSFDVQKLPDRPVSRIPCWDDATANWGQTCQEFVKQQLEATVPRPLAPPFGAGARASEFAFGDFVYGQYLASNPGDQMASAPPISPRTFADVQSRFLYLVLHGFENNGRYFKGSTGGGRVIDLANLAPPAPGTSLLADTIFTASCWGALISEFSAKRTDPGDPCGERTPDQSIPVAFLSFGSQGYIGFTGTHHGANTPGRVNVRYHSEPLHETFWERRRNQDMPPSPALFQARLDYLAKAPYRTSADLGVFIPSKDPFSRAVELKTFWSAICLGLGW